MACDYTNGAEGKRERAAAVSRRRNVGPSGRFPAMRAFKPSLRFGPLPPNARQVSGRPGHLLGGGGAPPALAQAPAGRGAPPNLQLRLEQRAGFRALYARRLHQHLLQRPGRAGAEGPWRQDRLLLVNVHFVAESSPGAYRSLFI